MKANKMLYLDIEVIEFMNKIGNMSELVNRLLLEHMDREEYERMPPEQLKREIEAKKLMKKAEKEAKAIRNGH